MQRMWNVYFVSHWFSHFSAFNNEYVNTPAATTRDETNRAKIASNLFLTCYPHCCLSLGTLYRLQDTALPIPYSIPIH